MRIKKQCKIWYDQSRDCFRVDIGIHIVHFGTLFSCEEWARRNAMPVANQAEINRVKYNNMPVNEMYCVDHITMQGVMK